jgi:aryl-alcohol dehydrogenase-like predicted oxidoreductase
MAEPGKGYLDMIGGTRMRQVELGSTGLRVSVLALGTGTNGWAHRSDQTRRGTDWLIGHLRDGYELGVNFWDLADQYGSHRCAREALRHLEREHIVITTKTTARDYQTCSRAVERYLKELGTDYLDIVLLHGEDSPDWNTQRRGAMDALDEAKGRGLVRAVGISSHRLDGIETAAAEPWLDVMLVTLNYASARMGTPQQEVVPVLRKAHARGKGIYAMKVLGCGRLASDPERAIQYILDLGCVHAMTIGHTEDTQLSQNVEIIDRLGG